MNHTIYEEEDLLQCFKADFKPTGEWFQGGSDTQKHADSYQIS